MSTKLFPPCLDQGSKGAAVNVLGLLLIAFGYELDGKEIDLDGDYTPGGAIASAVQAFQEEADFTGDDVDGNFGPKTREAFFDQTGIDIDSLTVEMFTQPTVGKGP